MTTILGVDPGASGALAILRDGEVELLDMPVGRVTVGKTAKFRISPELLAVALRLQLPIDAAYIEEVASMPRQGVSSTFTFGQAHGMVLGAVAMTGARLVRVRPLEWQRVVGLRGGKEKDDPRLLAARLYPSAAPSLTRKKDNGRADALLIAHYGRLQERGK
jgi:crossover junction endodeoxyribonuclease RuvC